MTKRPDADGFLFEEGDGPLIATAIHDGHELRPALMPLISLSSAARLREEDPHTADWTSLSRTRVITSRSRFEVDINRPREQAVYRRPEDAWGLAVWKSTPSDVVVEESLALYDRFYTRLGSLLERVHARSGAFVVLDLHSYNHRRAGPDAPTADPEFNPEVNIGTGSLDRDRWGAVVDTLMTSLRGETFLGHPLDVRENVKFFGGNMTRMINATFVGRGCSIAVEFKKFFMNEWTGELYEDKHRAIADALARASGPVLKALTQLRSSRH